MIVFGGFIASHDAHLKTVLHKLQARLLCFNYDMEYKCGVDNQVADCLSRVPLLKDTNPDLDTELETVAVVSTLLSAVPLTKFATESLSCPELTKLHKYVLNGWPAKAKSQPDDMTPYFPVRDELSIHDSYVLKGKQRLIAPLSVHSRLVTLGHKCHQGIVRTKQRLRELYCPIYVYIVSTVHHINLCHLPAS